MDIMQLITREHSELRRELSAIAGCLTDSRLEPLLDSFIEHVSTHERMEHNYLFDKVTDLVRRDTDRRTIVNYEKIHAALFDLLHEFRDTAKSHKSLAIRIAFLKFHSFVESHFSYEEDWLFPMIRHSVPLVILEEMAQEVQTQRKPHIAPQRGMTGHAAIQPKMLVEAA